MKEFLVNINNVSKQFEKEARAALQGITASIPKGEIVGLAGPDGSGKTTLIRLIAGLLLPTQGTITIGDYDTIKNASFVHHLIGYMPQKFGLYEDLTVLQNLNLYADLRGVTGEEKSQVFNKLLFFTGLQPFIDRLAKALSGGMKQKLGLACALLKKPALLLLDEPSVGVDPLSRRELWKMVHELLEEGISVVWSTAYLDEAEKCDTVLLLNDGKLLYNGSPSTLCKNVQGRVFKITDISRNRRNLLTQVLNQDNVMDGIIQGHDVRVVLKESSTLSIEKFLSEFDPKAKLVADSPRFEDAFIDILGGGPGGFSALAESLPKIEAKQDVIIEAKGLTKRFGSFTAADDITLSIRPGEIFGLLGPNGAGKTTTFKMMCGLLKPTHGSASVNGVDLQKAPGEARGHIGYMAQKFSLYDTLSLLQNLEFFAGIYNLTGKQKKKAIDQMIDIFNFKSYVNDTAHILPLGFKQRLALSCAVMHHPAVLFLDEPTSGVDPITRREFWNHINGLVRRGVTIMVTTHFMDEAENCDRIALVYRSKIIRTGTPDSLKEAAKTLDNPTPTLEDAFIQIIQQYDMTNAK